MFFSHLPNAERRRSLISTINNDFFLERTIIIMSHQIIFIRVKRLRWGYTWKVKHYVYMYENRSAKEKNSSVNFYYLNGVRYE